MAIALDKQPSMDASTGKPTRRCAAAHVADWLNPAKLAHESYVGTNPAEAAAAENALLSRYVKTPFTLSQVAIDLSNLGLGTQHIATLELNADAPGPALVWAHGAGAALGWGYRNFDELANLGGQRRRVLAFDWLGQGNSSRPAFPRRSAAGSEGEHIDAALAFFVESLEAWRKALGVDSMLLCAHSTGAFVAAHYAMTHPHRVARLVLHGAAGLGSQPQQIDERSGVFSQLWDRGVLNFGAIQRLGRLAKGPARQRFGRFLKARSGVDDPEALSLFFEYFWTASCARPVSSDPWVNAFLVPVSAAEHSGIYARRPLAEEPAWRLALLPPTSVIFGERDWVMTPSVVDATKRLRGRLHVVPGGNHHLYFDKPDKFHAVVAKALQGA